MKTLCVIRMAALLITAILLATSFNLAGATQNTLLPPIGMGLNLVPTPGSTSPYALDVNQDGKLDLVSLAINTRLKAEIVVQLGNGDGTFGKPLTTALAQPASAMILGDMNGDGIPDAVIQDFDVIYVALGHGDGTFGPEITSSAIGTILAFATGDFNGDGKLDLALSLQGEVAIMLGNGDGTLQAPVVAPGGSTQNISIATGDFNLDHKLDVAIVDNIDAAVVVFLGNGDGTLQAPTSYATTTGPLFLVVDDFNGDGKPDIVVDEVGKSGANLSHFLGNGDGTFQTRVDQVSVQDSGGLLAADFNGDGVLDVAVLSPSRDLVQIWLGTGDGSFSLGAIFPIAPSPPPRLLNLLLAISTATAKPTSLPWTRSGRVTRCCCRETPSSPQLP